LLKAFFEFTRHSLNEANQEAGCSQYFLQGDPVSPFVSVNFVVSWFNEYKWKGIINLAAGA